MAVTVGIFDKIFLVVLFGGIKVFKRFHFDREFCRIFAEKRFLPFLLYFAHFLFIMAPQNCRYHGIAGLRDLGRRDKNRRKK